MKCPRWRHTKQFQHNIKLLGLKISFRFCTLKAVELFQVQYLLFWYIWKSSYIVQCSYFDQLQYKQLKHDCCSFNPSLPSVNIRIVLKLFSKYFWMHHSINEGHPKIFEEKFKTDKLLFFNCWEYNLISILNNTPKSIWQTFYSGTERVKSQHNATRAYVQGLIATDMPLLIRLVEMRLLISCRSHVLFQGTSRFFMLEIGGGYNKSHHIFRRCFHKLNMVFIPPHMQQKYLRKSLRLINYCSSTVGSII